MLSEVDCGAHDTYTSECMLSEVYWEAHESHTSQFMLSEVDQGAHHSSFSFTWSTLTMTESQRTSSAKDYGESYHKEHSSPISWSA